MCGINGYVQCKTRLSETEISNLIDRMNDKVIHRGPDDSGVFVDQQVGLGQRRLSIIDLSTGKQPIYNEDRSIVVVFNGEIYNFKNLRINLIAKGHQFYTDSDTEVIVHAYEEYGTQCFNRLDGMFSIAIYNIKENKLILARDRAGEKPLYYYHGQEMFLFASELKSILSTGLIEKEIDKVALNQYLSLTYIPAPLTIFKDIYKLCPGYYMEIVNGKTEISQYWNVKYYYNNLIDDYDTCKKELRKALFESVEQCMVSDVPIGAFLSGGIDSTIITGIMSKISNRPIETFTIGYKNNKRYDESDRAEKSALLHQANHHVNYLEFSDVVDEIDCIVSNIDEPFADSSLIPTYMVSKYAKEHVKVVLTGDAGDELFAGYDKYLKNYYVQKYNKFPNCVKKIVAGILNILPVDSHLHRKMNKVVQASKLDLFALRLEAMKLGIKNDILINNFNSEKLFDFAEKYYREYNERVDELSQTLYMDLKVVLEGDMLVKVDRAAMLNSLETRTPMLEKNVIEIAARIPSKYKIQGKNLKVILKDTFSDLIPSDIINAPKRGFGVPIGDWLRDELKEELISLLNKEFLEVQGLFDSDSVKSMMEDHFNMKTNNGNQLWTLFVFQKWYKSIFKKVNSG